MVRSKINEVSSHTPVDPAVWTGPPPGGGLTVVNRWHLLAGFRHRARTRIGIGRPYGQDHKYT